MGVSLGASVASVASVGAHGYPRFLNLGAEGTRGFEQMPLAASAAPIQESVLPIVPLAYEEISWIVVSQYKPEAQASEYP